MILGLATAGGGCNVYDPELVMQQEAASTRAGAFSPGPPDASNGDSASPRPDGGAPGSGSDASTMTARPAVCGDGLVSGDELCDTGIAEDQPGACPPEVCPPLSQCGLRARRGEGCQAACVLLPEACVDGDRCCPSACSGEQDSDCSQSCGDGEVQEEDQETCEDGTDTPCPSEGDCDDGIACTQDVLLGSAANCNAECANTPITTLVEGDGCCPEGANANTDPDCEPRCGNDVREDGEECDGGEGCSAQCAVLETPPQRECLDRFADDDCLRCACTSCTQLMFDCFDSGDSTRDMHCATINRCARENDCASTPCYCGTSPTCLFPDGPCVDEIHAAASAPEPRGVQQDTADGRTAIGRADRLAQCEITNCSDVCP